MANALTNLAKDGLLGLLFRAAAWAGAPTEWHVALFSSVTSIPLGTVTELTGDGYARQTVTFNVELAGVIDNNGAISFGVATADWNTVTHYGIFDAATSGNLLMVGNLDKSRTVYEDDTLTIDDQAIEFSLPA